ncbi:lipoprotein NlpI [Shewanella sp. NFH-SH190041]|uniref:lipoprotein NlpI n=1 Tax=Shewanella sp. NFH-SH190041 TaxID=2950245 RepID=UPI0021C303F3|nr:lipoprotein NlpI [Shewanella sp. NFH-SH190041]BDM63401.1 lipoprotein NlpI [Shewanella sp. NFH-SH190041]
MKVKFPTLLPALMLGMSVLITGCASSPERADMQGKLVVTPVGPEYKNEVTLAKLNEILGAMELTKDQRARFLYERGVVYDALGLRLLARIDFHQALKINPRLADVYNFIGIYYTQEGEFENAYEAFDGVLELAPDYDYAYLNRGIALYYGQRDKLALADLRKFYSLDPSDGYRALWLYLADVKVHPQTALQTLAQNSEHLTAGQWPTELVDFYLGRISKTQLFDAAKVGVQSEEAYAQRLCEAYFYLAKWEMARGHDQQAANYLRLALATNIYDFVEHRYAQLELQKLAEKQQDAEKSAAASH